MKPKYFDPQEIELAHQEIEFYNITNAFNEKIKKDSKYLDPKEEI